MYVWKHRYGKITCDWITKKKMFRNSAQNVIDSRANCYWISLPNGLKSIFVAYIWDSEWKILSIFGEIVFFFIKGLFWHLILDIRHEFNFMSLRSFPFFSPAYQHCRQHWITGLSFFYKVFLTNTHITYRNSFVCSNSLIKWRIN